MLRLPRIPGVGGGSILIVALLVVLPFDVVVHDFTFRHLVTHEVRLLSNGVTHLGTAWAGMGVLGALAAVGHRTGDAGLVRAGVAGLAGVALGSVASHVAKQATCRGRPVLLDGWGVGSPVESFAGTGRPTASRFFHWPCLTDSRYHSFPSGHATTVFAVAAALVQCVPSRRAAWLTVAVGVGASRVFLNAHFLSDVVGGALIGWWAVQIGSALVDRFMPLLPEPARLSAIEAGPLSEPSGP